MSASAPGSQSTHSWPGELSDRRANTSRPLNLQTLLLLPVPHNWDAKYPLAPSLSFWSCQNSWQGSNHAVLFCFRCMQPTPPARTKEAESEGAPIAENSPAFDVDGRREAAV